MLLLMATTTSLRMTPLRILWSLLLMDKHYCRAFKPLCMFHFSFVFCLLFQIIIISSCFCVAGVVVKSKLTHYLCSPGPVFYLLAKGSRQTLSGGNITFQNVTFQSNAFAVNPGPANTAVFKVQPDQRSTHLLCSALLCSAVLCSALLCFGTLFFVICSAILVYSLLRTALPYSATFCFVLLRPSSICALLLSLIHI